MCNISLKQRCVNVKMNPNDCLFPNQGNYALHDKHLIEWKLVFMKLLRIVGKSSFVESYYHHISSEVGERK